MRVSSLLFDRFPHSSIRRLVALLALSLVALGGCDLGTYSSRYEERLPQLTRRAQLASRLHSTFQSLEISNVIEGAPAVPDGGNLSLGAKIRLPNIFDAESRKLSPADPPSIAAPPGIQLPIGLAYERYVANSESDRLPIYFYLMAFPKATVELADVEGQIKGVLDSRLETVPSWQAQSIETLDGGTLEFRSLVVSQAQPFVVQRVDNAPEPQALEGQLHFYARTVGDYHLVFVFRYPSQIADSLGFPDAIHGSLGTLQAQ